MPTPFNRCQEHPSPFGGVCEVARPVPNVGYVVTVRADGYSAMKVEGRSLSKGSVRTPVDIHPAVRFRTRNTNVPGSAWTPSSR